MPIYGKNETLHCSSTNTLFIYEAKKFGSETLFEGYIISFITQKVHNFKFLLSFVCCYCPIVCNMPEYGQR